MGSRVCVRTTMPNRPGFVFVEGAIIDVQNDTKTYTVQLLNGTNKQEKMYHVKRAHIRLLRPPWWDELNDAGTMATSVANNNKKPYTSSNMGRSGAGTGAIMYGSAATVRHMDGGVGGGSSGRLKYTTAPRVDATGAPLQVHQVIPMLQVSLISSSSSSTSSIDT